MELKPADCLIKVAEIVGTGNVRGNEICRLFILPEYQAKGNHFGQKKSIITL